MEDIVVGFTISSSINIKGYLIYKTNYIITFIIQKAVLSFISYKELINLIKPHTEAFKDYPAQLEEHKGKLEYLDIDKIQ